MSRAESAHSDRADRVAVSIDRFQMVRLHESNYTSINLFFNDIIYTYSTDTPNLRAVWGSSLRPSLAGGASRIGLGWVGWLRLFLSPCRYQAGKRPGGKRPVAVI